MATQAVRDLVNELPWRMRESVEGYVDAVAVALPEIEDNAGIRLPENKVDQFLFVVAIRRIWAAINSQYWIIEDSVAVATREGLTGFQLGRDRYVEGSDAVGESRELRSTFQALLVELGVEQLVSMRSLADVLNAVAAGD